MSERYSIEVNDEAVVIYGDISIEEAFDFMNFFDKKGFKSLSTDDSTLYLRRKSIAQIDESVRVAEHINSEKFYEGLYEASKQQVEKLGYKIRQLEGLIKELIQTGQEKQARIFKENESLKRSQMLLKLRNNPEVQQALENFITGGSGKVVEDFRPFDNEPMTEEEKKLRHEELLRLKEYIPHLPDADETDNGESKNKITHEGDKCERPE